MNRPRPKTRGKWKKGPPPSIGWWPASYYRAHWDIRWWDGKVWSRPVDPYRSAEEAASVAEMPAAYSFDIEWTERWW